MESVGENYVLAANLLEKLSQSRWLAVCSARFFRRFRARYFRNSHYGFSRRIPRIPNCFSDKKKRDISYSRKFLRFGILWWKIQLMYSNHKEAGSSVFSDRHSQPLFIARWTLGEENHKVFGKTFNYSLGDGSGYRLRNFQDIILNFLRNLMNHHNLISCDVLGRNKVNENSIIHHHYVKHRISRAFIKFFLPRRGVINIRLTASLE